MRRQYTIQYFLWQRFIAISLCHLARYRENPVWSRRKGPEKPGHSNSRQKTLPCQASDQVSVLQSRRSNFNATRAKAAHLRSYDHQSLLLCSSTNGSTDKNFGDGHVVFLPSGIVELDELAVNVLQRFVLFHHGSNDPCQSVDAKFLSLGVVDLD
ncbi:MAG: hypothetical protein HW380_257 [Magnetococcales bacterium]|nr:hypothetical protein [Magnetococcales bacterium]